MSPTPSATVRLFGNDLVLTRTFRLAVSAGDGNDRWLLEMALTETAGVTELRFTQHVTTTDAVGEVGPGWEYYLDALAAAREDRPLPTFDDYYPSLKEHFEAQR